MSKFVLINPRSEDTRKNTYPLGLAYIAASMRSFGEVVIFDLHYENSEDKVLEFIWTNKVNFVGISVCSHPGIVLWTSHFAKEIKTLSPDTIVCIGGPHATFQGEELIQRHYEFDVAIIGAGELAAKQLADNIAQKKKEWFLNVKNIIYRDFQNNVVVSSTQCHNMNLELNGE